RRRIGRTTEGDGEAYVSKIAYRGNECRRGLQTTNKPPHGREGRSQAVANRHRGAGKWRKCHPRAPQPREQADFSPKNTGNGPFCALTWGGGAAPLLPDDPPPP